METRAILYPMQAIPAAKRCLLFSPWRGMERVVDTCGNKCQHVGLGRFAYLFLPLTLPLKNETWNIIFLEMLPLHHFFTLLASFNVFW